MNIGLEPEMMQALKEGLRKNYWLIELSILLNEAFELYLESNGVGHVGGAYERAIVMQRIMEKHPG